jgi:RNA 3'-terminal phosphate cyclase-like protein
MSDVFIYGDHFKGKESGLSSGFGVTLVAESTTGCLMSSEVVAKPQQLPEDVGKEAANRLLLEILRRGCVDSTCQSVLILMMALGPEDVSKIRVGKLTPYSYASILTF